MAETPYCPLLSIGKDNPVLCQEELCMLYVKQLKLCAITVQGYAQAINIQPQMAGGAKPGAEKKSKLGPKPAMKQPEPAKEPQNAPNPFAMDDLD